MIFKAPSTNRLVHARRFCSRYLVPRDHPHPEQVRAQMDDITTTVLRDALGATLHEYLDPASDVIWFIRRLELDVSVNAAWDADRLARVWAAQVARALVTVIESDGGDDMEVVRFENRTTYVSQFMSDLIDDCAWSKWYYRSFDGLKMLPVPAAIRTLVCDDPRTGIDALAQLSPEKISRVVSTLSANDARRVLHAIPFAEAKVNMRVLLETAWRAYDAIPSLIDYTDDDRAALRVCLEVARVEPHHLDRSLYAAARAISRLIRLVQRSPEVMPTVRQILDSGSPTPLYVVVSSEDASALGPLVEGSPAWLDEVFQVATMRASGRAASQPVEEATLRQTPFGGAMILLPILAELPLGEATRNWPSCGDTSAEAITRFLILAKCLGGTCAPRMMLDMTIREILGVHPRTSLSDVVTWYAKLDRRQHSQFVSAMAQWMRKRFGVNYRSYAADGDAQRSLVSKQYLAFMEPVIECPSARRSFGLAAFAVMTSFARKLPGFSQSSLPHLRANFLECTATIEDQPTRRVVQLTRPPLDFILNMTGLSRATYRIAWLDGRPISLFPHGGG